MQIKVSDYIVNFLILDKGMQCIHRIEMIKRLAH